jgi:putative ABC transport system ATP-binding protein
LILETTALSYDFGSGKELQFPDLQITAGEKIIVVGPSGSGKSTFLNLLSGVLPIQTGSIRLLGNSYRDLSPIQLDTVRANHIGIIFQSLNLIPYLSGFDNAFLGLEFSKARRTKVEDRASAAALLGSGLGLTLNTLKKKPHQLSIGQQQRIAVIRAMLGSPELILADEPTSALDPKATKNFVSELNDSIEKSAQAIVVVSHNPDLIPWFDRVISLGGD